MRSIKEISKLSALSVAVAVCSFAKAETETEEVTVMANATYVSSLVTESMLNQQSPLTSINSVIDNLPGVSINEGDAYGFDDWSTEITIRGFSTNLGEQYIGTTIDGIPNGGSNYGGGSKANRFLDPANLAGVNVSQGTSDIASASLEALGGTIDFVTSDPEDDQRIRAQVGVGDFDAQRVYLRYDSGLLGDSTAFWVSYSTQEASDWIAESAENERDHVAAKLKSKIGETSITAYVSYDDIQEDNYQRIYNEAQYDMFPDTDGLTSEWTGVPFEDQLYRRGWSTLRENLLAYVKADFNFSENIKLNTSIYHHQNEGRGDWLPPYLINATDDDGGNTEYLGGTTSRNPNVDVSDRIYFVDADGNRLSPISECTGTYTVTNWYGVPSATAPAIFDPACYAQGAIAVQSFRNTHYEKDRTGLIADLTWTTMFGNNENEVRAGVWYEDQTRDEYRDWHSVNTREGFVYNAQPYWIQYDRTYPTETTKWYVQDKLTVSDLTFSLGIKQFLIDVEREDRFEPELAASIESDSDVLFSGGVVWDTPVEGLEAFVGYAENFKALNDLVLERPAADFDNLDPETSETTEVGLRYDVEKLSATAVYFQNDFENRLIFLGADSVAGPDFTIGTNGSYFNAGGIDSSGLELSVNYEINSMYSVYAAYTFNDATYLGSGDTSVDEGNGITPGNDVAGIAESLFVASFDFKSDVFYGGVSAKFTGDRYVNAANSWVADAYTLTDVYVGVDFENLGEIFSNLNVALTVNNLFDEDYLGTIAQNAAWIGGKRTTVLALTMDF